MKVGSGGVTKVAEGDKVAISFNSCGQCAHCEKGEPAYCHNFMAYNFGGVRPDAVRRLPPVTLGSAATSSDSPPSRHMPSLMSAMS